MTILIAFFALVLGIINFIYLFYKDKRIAIESDRKECIAVIKYVFEQSLKNEKDFKPCVLDAYIHALVHIKIIKSSRNNEAIKTFAVAISDFNGGWK
ncbi:hypothetical protein [Helicobacter trogontum]|uniref:Uncharacterized protein n=1 Tax=Helicobacter trogontum TaxID=50960 RepID=A0A4U8S996_9HELI|nr:hypothetical protein [Helicobacter trogontum]TLD82564.1 hypothetical protein LS81_007375 [Helicobacter trogontum]